MNLNSYLGLMGRSYCLGTAPGGGTVLLAAGTRTPDLVVPDADYVLTLDADTILLPEYCPRLVHFMEQPENRDVAVVQTPYSAYRGAASKIERFAGATTDVQHILHQGSTTYDATFWVGANAVIRKRALDELKNDEDEGGFVISRFIRDHTLIEDTESSIDLRVHGWRLYNFPERLSYSATPPDFAPLIIQRQRWANGGLVILPALWKLAFKRRARVRRPGMAELFLGTNYLASIAWSSVGLLILLFYPFEGGLLSPVAALTALPYFIAVATDPRRGGLSRDGRRRRLRLQSAPPARARGGTVQSLVQAISGRKMAFARTPKEQNRTVAPLFFVGLPLLLVAWSTVTLFDDIEHRNYMHGVFAGTNMLMTAYACLAYVGVRNTVVDILINFRAFVYRPVQRRSRRPPCHSGPLGGSVPEEVTRAGTIAVALAAQDRFDNVRRLPRLPLPPAAESAPQESDRGDRTYARLAKEAGT